MRPYDTLTYAGQVRRLRRLALQALAAYDIGQPRLTPLTHADNTTFRVDTVDGERYVLRIHRPSRKTLSPSRCSTCASETTRRSCARAFWPATAASARSPPSTNGI